MPQLDKLSFIPQLFWLIVFFLGLYIIVYEVILPRLNTIFQVRALKKLIHNVRVSALENEKASNTVYSTIFGNLFTNNDLFVEYLSRFKALTPKSFGESFYNTLKDLRVNSAVDIETAYYKMRVKKQITTNLLKNEN